MAKKINWKEILQQAKSDLVELERKYSEQETTNECAFPKVEVPYETECISCDVAYTEVDVDNEVTVYEVDKMESYYLCMDCGYTYVSDCITNAKVRISMLEKQVS